MRLFIACEIGGEFLDGALAAQKRLKACGADVKWVSAYNMHFTLHFLGETPPERLEAAKSAVAAAEGTGSFTVELGASGVFPDAAAPRVVWLGVQDKAGGLNRLAGCVGAKLREAGFETEERPFVPHLTLGRVKSQRGAAELAARLKNPGPAKPAVWEINKVSLFESALPGPVYNKLFSADLQAKQ